MRSKRIQRHSHRAVAAKSLTHAVAAISRDKRRSTDGHNCHSPSEASAMDTARLTRRAPRQNTQRRRAVVSALIVAALAAALTACGSDTTDSATSSGSSVSTSSSTVVPTSAAPTEMVVDFDAEAEWTFKLTGDGGYTSNARVIVGAPIRDEVTLATTVTGPVACAIDWQRDLVLPMGFEVKSTTSDFDQRLGMSFRLQDRSEDARFYGVGQVEGHVADMDVECIDTSPASYAAGGWGSEAFGAYRSGAGFSDRVRWNGLLIIGDIRTPEDPDGLTKLNDLGLIVDGNTSTENYQTAELESGPWIPMGCGEGKGLHVTFTAVSGVACSPPAGTPSGECVGLLGCEES